MQRKRTLGGILAALTVVLIGTSSAASTVSAAPASLAVPSVITLPLFGVPLTIEVAAGPGGALTSVSVNPADGLTATTVKPNKVVFVNEDGTAKVVVRGRVGGQRVEVKAGALADVSGPGGWSGDVFGSGAITNVSFTVAATADGGPDITGVSSSDPTAVIGATEYHSNEHHHLRMGASVRVTFISGGQTRSLWINAVLKIYDDGVTCAKVSVTLRRLHGVVQPVADAIGIKTWVGLLCDGTEASITYTVNEDGSLSDVSAIPDTAVVAADGNKVRVRFASGERVKIRSHSSADGIKVSVHERIRCRDSADPTVNTPIDTSAGHDDHDGDRHGDVKRHGDGDRRDGDDHGKRHG